MRKSEKKALIQNYKQFLLFYFNMEGISKKDQEFYNGKLKGFELSMELLDINFKNIKKEMRKEEEQFKKEVDEFLGMF